MGSIQCMNGLEVTDRVYENRVSYLSELLVAHGYNDDRMRRKSVNSDSHLLPIRELAAIRFL